MLNERIAEIYEEFKNLSSRPKIVRDGQYGDAFVLLVFETIFYHIHNRKRLVVGDREFIERYIVPPSDDGIDIFFEELDLDERKYHLVQVKNSILAQSEIEQCFSKMKRAIEVFFESRKESSKNLKRIISTTGFSKDDSIEYYVVHTGNVDKIRNQKPNEKIITEESLIRLRKASLERSDDSEESVPEGYFEIDTANNFILQNFVDEKKEKIDFNLPQSILCNLSGYDLAKLDNEYSDTELGRNILYGGNLRESLSKKSKTYANMVKTIDAEPSLFLFYNNGITILTDNFDVPGKHKQKNGKEKISLKNFSIINGAQTTSTLGAYLREAKMNNDEKKIENLKKVFVLTKIYEINTKLNDHKKISQNIKLYNNTQTPLSSRDMVSIRTEQKSLQNRLLKEGYPNLFVHIKKGRQLPKDYKLLRHQEVTNETLAQLTLCGFFFEPFNAKDKKVKIFDNEGKDEFLLNPLYDKLFNEKRGILFSKTHKEIDELLFISRLHDDTKNSYRRALNEQIQNLSQNSPQSMGYTNEDRDKEIVVIRRNLDIANNCLFYNMTYYFQMRQRFDFKISNIEMLGFDTQRYYEDKDFKESFIDSFERLFFSKTVELIRKKSAGENVTNWVRIEGNQPIFLEALRNHFSDHPYLLKDYQEFVKNFKILVN